jgi:hypothetical protein
LRSGISSSSYIIRLKELRRIKGNLEGLVDALQDIKLVVEGINAMLLVIWFMAYERKSF